MPLQDITFHTIYPYSVTNLTSGDEIGFHSSSRGCKVFAKYRCPDQFLEVQRCGVCVFAREDHEKFAGIDNNSLYTESNASTMTTQIREPDGRLLTLIHNKDGDTRVEIISEKTSPGIPERSLIQGGRRR